MAGNTPPDDDGIDIGVIDVSGAPPDQQAASGRGSGQDDRASLRAPRRERERERDDYEEDIPKPLPSWKKYLVPAIAIFALASAVAVVILPRVLNAIGGVSVQETAPPLAAPGAWSQQQAYQQQAYQGVPPYAPQNGQAGVLAPTAAPGAHQPQQMPSQYGYAPPVAGQQPQAYGQQAQLPQAAPVQTSQQQIGQQIGQASLTPTQAAPGQPAQLGTSQPAALQSQGSYPPAATQAAVTAPSTLPPTSSLSQDDQSSPASSQQQDRVDRARIEKVEADVAQMTTVLGVLLTKVDDVATQVGKVSDSVEHINDGLRKSAKPTEKAEKADKPTPKPKKAEESSPAPSVAWKLGGVAGNNAWLSNERGEMRQVSVGKELEGLGKVLSIEQSGGRWIVRAEKGFVSQR